MSCTRRDFLALLGGGTALSLAACADSNQQSADTQAATTQASTVDKTEFKDLAIDMSAWHHDDVNDVWWQTSLAYCKDPATKTYETLGIYVPGAYMEGEAKGDTYTCTIKQDAQVGQFTSATAPVVMPLNAAGFSAQAAPTTFLYDGLAPYLSAGLIYVYAGFRGRSNGYDSSSTASGDGFFSGGAPWGIVDLKAAIRYLRYNKAALPGDMSRVFPFGHAAGGSLASILGSTGDSDLFSAYIKKIGAATHDADGEDVSDAVSGVACWCPVTGLGVADAAYEWSMGQYFSTDTRAEGTWTGLVSDDLASTYATYVNSLDLRDDSGSQLTLDETDGGIYTDGTYYDYLLTLVQDSLNQFLAAAQFPYTPATHSLADGSFPGAGTTFDTATATAASQGGDSSAGATAEAKTYASASEYFAALNGDDSWLTYNERKNTVRITSLEAFVQHCRIVSKGVLGFDGVDRAGVANQLFGNDDSDTLHFSQVDSDLLALRQDTYATMPDWDATLPATWADDLTKTDTLEVGVGRRRDMYDPLYFLSGAFGGYGTAKVAPRWRINAGLFNTDMPVTAETNLALALKHYDGVTDVSFSEVWGKGRELAETSGDSIANMVAWVQACCQ